MDYLFVAATAILVAVLSFFEYQLGKAAGRQEWLRMRRCYRSLREYLPKEIEKRERS